jgi:3-isopropylmalate/(R)-2-methylmalate dehydratase large subunit
MGSTMIEKILSNHSDQKLKAGDIADVFIDARIARDFGGANVVKNLQDSGLSIDDASRTYFTFDCNPGGSDQKYASNQQMCRLFAREQGITIFDVTSGIGTHVAIDKGLIKPGGTLISTDSHANILGAIGAFGQGMGDQDISAGFAHGRVWFKVPLSMKVVLKGKRPSNVTAKDIALLCLKHFGASGLLGYSAEFYGDAVDRMNLSERITIASMATEMAGIIAFFPPNEDVIDWCKNAGGADFEPVYADNNARYDKTVEINISDLKPMISRPGHPEDVVPVSDVAGRKIDSAFLGSCTNGRFEDMLAAANILDGRKVAPGVVLKVVPATRDIWQLCLDEGIIEIFMREGALVGNAGCAGCAAGQLGQNGPGEVTISTGNRNFAGKQGKGEVYLASPETVIASAIAGYITTEDKIPDIPAVFGKSSGDKLAPVKIDLKVGKNGEPKPIELTGRVWVIDHDNIDTDMIFHNRYLTITDPKEMGQYTFDNLKGWEDFAKKVQPGDIVVTGVNFGAGSSRQQAVDCFQSLGVQLIIAKSFGAIYERNAINAGMPIITGDLISSGIKDGETISVDLSSGQVKRHSTNEKYKLNGFADIQMEIYQRGGLLKASSR